MPASRMAAISSVVATGRRMNSRDGFIAAPDSSSGVAGAAAGGRRLVAMPALAVRRLAAGTVLAGGAVLPGRRRRLLGPGDGHGGAVAQLVGAVDHHLLAGR